MKNNLWDKYQKKIILKLSEKNVSRKSKRVIRKEIGQTSKKTFEEDVANMNRKDTE